jgi:octaprenyl-diphosphate synthase
VLETSAPTLPVVDPLESAMRQVDAVIRDRLASRVALIDQISRYIVSAGGKRIRPRLVLLF